MSTPQELDITYYKEANIDLIDLSDDELVEHYDQHGKKEGRWASPYMGRENFVTEVEQHDKILEIGPYFAPYVTGTNVKYFDIYNSTKLAELAKSIDEPTENVPDEIHYVSPNANLEIIDEQFDAIVSSHCIEHQPDLIRHLRQLKSMLSPGGKIYFIIPDKRYCFDNFMVDTNVCDVIDAYDEKRKIHTKKSLINNLAYSTHNDPARHWQGDHGSYEDNLHEKVLNGERMYEEAQGAYLDTHAWYLTPTNFKNIINELQKRQYIDLEASRVYETPVNRFEFCAILN